MVGSCNGTGGGEPPALNDVGVGRTPDQLVKDADAVRQQRAALSQDERAEAFQRNIVEAIQGRRADVEGVERFTVLDGTGTFGGTPVLCDSLLVRASLETLDPVLFASLVEQVGQPEAKLDGRLFALCGNSLETDRIADIARTVRERGYEASVDHIVPLGVVIKGEGGPARTFVDDAALRRPERMDGSALVAVIDTGVPGRGHEHDWHSGLGTGDNLDGLDVFPPGGDGLLDAAAGHGAFATGIVQQVAPGGAVTVRSAIDSDGIGSEVRVAEELLRVVREQGAEIVNLSLGTQTVDDQPLLALQVAFELLAEGGHDDVLLVAAAGNYGDTRPCWPAAFRQVVAVAGLTNDLEPASWSSHGFWVDVSTVAEGLVSSYVRGRESPELSPGPGLEDDWPLDDPRPWAVWTGTSFAAPQIAAEVARRLAEQRANGDTAATPRAALAGLLSEGRRIPDYGVAVHILSGTPVAP